ncbi:MAG TPA: DUF1543 domain-containing protein [Oligoflexia bacterium]|nr:DUF1543 domain-containing protein [Oligoflexia bacterium]HMR25660.1 DUF1543 domain-containing protein [Oligoflexia bacterium]
MQHKLFLIVLGATPPGRNIEQHDVMFAVGKSIEDTYPKILQHWSVKGVHIDAYVEVTQVDGFKINIVNAKQDAHLQANRLYFINLGGYMPNDIEEYHKKILVAASNKIEAKRKVKTDDFFKQGLQEKNACPHYDDQFEIVGFDVDNCLLLDEHIEKCYSIELLEDHSSKWINNKKVIGYFPIKQ